MNARQEQSERKQPLRTCVACRQTSDKRNLVRFVRGADKRVALDRSGRAAGRGAYVCAQADCFARAWKSRALERALRVSLKDDDYRLLAEDLEAVIYGDC